MSTIEDSIEIIKSIECPTGELENRITQTLESNGVGENNEITVKRETSLDVDGAEAYSVKISSNSTQDIVVLAKSGYDDYVAKVVDVYIS